MAENLREYFDNPTDSGLIDNVIIDVSPDTFFAPDGRINNGDSQLLQLRGTYINVEGEQGALDSESDRIFFKCGATKEWPSHDGGRTVVSPKDKIKFHTNSHFGMVVERLAAPKDKGGLGLRDELVKRGLLPTDAGFLVGLRLRWKREEETFQIDGKEIKTNRLMPAEVVAAGAVAPTPVEPTPATTSAPVDATAAKVAAAKAAAAAAQAQTNGSGLRDKVVEIAKAAATWAEFQNQALSLDGVASDDALLIEIVDESDNGLFAKVKASA